MPLVIPAILAGFLTAGIACLALLIAPVAVEDTQRRGPGQPLPRHCGVGAHRGEIARVGEQRQYITAGERTADQIQDGASPPRCTD